MTPPKERPILFSSSMVRAILEGRKTQTRRVVKPQPVAFDSAGMPWQPRFIERLVEKDIIRTDKTASGAQIVKPIPCPYGQPGDRLWQDGKPSETGFYYIRGLLGEQVGGDERAVWYNHKYETWGFTTEDDPESIYADGFSWNGWKRPGDRLWVRETWNKHGGLTTYKADGDWIKEFKTDHDRKNPIAGYEAAALKWRPSIHMPRWASRITLEITGVRVERLQDGGDREFWGEKLWAENPWVWVIEFKKV